MLAFAPVLISSSVPLTFLKGILISPTFQILAIPFFQCANIGKSQFSFALHATDHPLFFFIYIYQYILEGHTYKNIISNVLTLSAVSWYLMFFLLLLSDPKQFSSNCSVASRLEVFQSLLVLQIRTVNIPVIQGMIY